MGREEFLAVLQEALKGEIPDYEIAGHLQYYDGYIRENDGKTEEEKLNELGDPRLIAKTIIDARSLKGGHAVYQESYEQEYSQGGQKEQEKARYKIYTWDGLTWYQKLLASIVLLLILAVIIVIAGVGIHIFFAVVLPVLAVVFIIRLLISAFR